MVWVYYRLVDKCTDFRHILHQETYTHDKNTSSAENTGYRINKLLHSEIYFVIRYMLGQSNQDSISKYLLVFLPFNLFKGPSYCL